MKQYDFETVIKRRGVGSGKWDEMSKYEVGEDVIPFSVADMEFKNAPEITEGLKSYIDSTVLGYAMPTDAYKSAVKGWLSRRHGWDIEKSWIRDMPGVIAAFFTAVKAFTKEGEGVMLMTPVYYPMYFAIQRNNRVLVDNKLKNCGDHYEIDFEDFEAKAKDPNTKLLILCSPHNPTGRVWTREELTKIGKICVENNIIVVSDEIHNDLVMPGYKHTVFASICDEFAQISLTCTAPSKTFNLAGLQTSNVIIPNDKLRETFFEEVCTTEGNPKCNILGLEGCRLAYENCGEWLDQVLEIINTNRKVIIDFLAKEFPKIKVYNLEGTYLLWMDFSELGIEYMELAKILREDASLFFDDGYIFGDQGAGYERWNLACPTKYINEGLERLKTALNKHLK